LGLYILKMKKVGHLRGKRKKKKINFH